MSPKNNFKNLSPYLLSRCGDIVLFTFNVYNDIIFIIMIYRAKVVPSLKIVNGVFVYEKNE